MFSSIIYNIPYILFFMPILFSIGTCLIENKQFNVFSVFGTLLMSSFLLLTSLLKINVDSNLFVSIKGAESLIGGEFRINNLSLLFALALTVIHIFIFLNTNYEFLKIDKKKETSHRKYFFMTYLLNIFSLFGIIFTSSICNYFIFLELYSFTLYIIVSDYKDKEDLKNSFNYFLNSICGSIIVLLSIFFLSLFFNSYRMIYIMQKFLTTNITSNIMLLFIVALFFIGLTLKFFSLDIIFYKSKSRRDARNLLSFLVLFVNNTLSIYSILYFLKYLFNIDYIFEIVYVKTCIISLGIIAILYCCYSIIKNSTLFNFIKRITNIYIALIVICIGLNNKYSTYLALLFIFEHLTSDFIIYLMYNYFIEKYNNSKVCLTDNLYSKILFIFLICLKMFLPIGVLFYIQNVILFDLSGYSKYILLTSMIIVKLTYLFFLLKNLNILKIDHDSVEYNDSYSSDLNINFRKIEILKYSIFLVFTIIVISTFFISHLKILFM